MHSSASRFVSWYEHAVAHLFSFVPVLITGYHDCYKTVSCNHVCGHLWMLVSDRSIYVNTKLVSLFIFCTISAKASKLCKYFGYLLGIILFVATILFKTFGNFMIGITVSYVYCKFRSE